jgi:hypothetical protein
MRARLRVFACHSNLGRGKNLESHRIEKEAAGIPVSLEALQEVRSFRRPSDQQIRGPAKAIHRRNRPLGLLRATWQPAPGERDCDAALAAESASAA